MRGRSGGFVRGVETVRLDLGLGSAVDTSKPMLLHRLAQVRLEWVFFGGTIE